MCCRCRLHRLCCLYCRYLDGSSTTGIFLRDGAWHCRGIFVLNHTGSSKSVYEVLVLQVVCSEYTLHVMAGSTRKARASIAFLLFCAIIALEYLLYAEPGFLV